jgi:putative ABC transport system permease protein
MATFREWVNRLWATVRPIRDDRDLEQELRLHVEMAAEDSRRRGHAPERALRAARIQVGGLRQAIERQRDQRGLPWLEDLAKDLRYTLRTLRRNPGFSAIAVLSLALGIGANSTMFSLVNGVMLRTLPAMEPDRLVHIARFTQQGRRPAFVSYPLFELFRDHVRSVSGVFAQLASSQTILIDGEDDLVTADAVSGAYFAVLGVEPAAGRLLTPADDRLSSSPAAVITDRYWHRRFGRSPSAVGKSITIRDRVFTIVGVTPPAFEGAQSGRASDLMIPLLMMTNDEQRRSVGFNMFNVLGRLKPGATVEQANAEVQTLFSAFLQANVPPGPEERRAQFLRQRAGAVSAPDGFNPVRDTIAPALLLLMGIVGLILMLACVNLSGLLLARAEARQREVSIRLAIGAGRGRLARQFLTESLVLASLGGAFGLAIAAWISPKLFELLVNGRELVLSVAPDGRVLAFTASVSLIACLVAGLAPALQAVRVSVNPALKQASAHERRRLGKVLVTAQFAISMVLIVGATLFIGTLVKLYAVDRGFESDGLLIVNVRSIRPYPAARAAAVQSSLLDRLRAMPGVRSASAARVLPVDGNLWDRAVQVEGYAFSPNESTSAGFNVIAPGYFATIGTPVLSGREFGDRDARTAPKVALVNERCPRLFRRRIGARPSRDLCRRDLRNRRCRARREVPEPSRRRAEDDVHPVDAA